MPYREGRAFCLFAITFGLTQLGISQTLPTPSSHQSNNNSSDVVATFQASTHMVTLEVVAKDRLGHHATGLTASDFQVFEQSPHTERFEQKIAAFREVQVADLAHPHSGESEVAAGLYTNAVAPKEEPVPPTILLLDGLNTELKFQAQVHVQMVRMLKSLPRNVPVAVVLFGNRLRTLQDFTTDPSLLLAAVEKATTAAGEGQGRLDPRDDPKALAGEFEKLNRASAGTATTPRQGASVGDEEVQRIPQWVVDAVKRFEQDVYAASVDTRVQQTIAALVSLARHVEGYPGRKNLLWVSTSFPIYLSPLIDDSGKPISDVTGLEAAGQRNYGPQLRLLATVLSEAKVAVYPINPAGVQAPTLFEADNRVRDYDGRSTGDSLRRETMMRGNEQDTMRVLAEGTGGQVCTGTNDLSDCIRKAVDDSSTFYEIAYYSDSRTWNGEYRKIIVKTREPGVHLAYRQGYFARPRSEDNPTDQKAELQQAACDDYLTATSVSFSAKSLPPDSPGQLKFYLTINPSALTLTPTADGGHHLNISVAVCTFDKRGWPFEFMSDAIERRFDASEYRSLTAHGLPHVVSIPGPTPPTLRLLVRDIPSGRLGSVNVKVEGSGPATSAPRAEESKTQPARP